MVDKDTRVDTEVCVALRQVAHVNDFSLKFAAVDIRKIVRRQRNHTGRPHENRAIIVTEFEMIHTFIRHDYNFVSPLLAPSMRHLFGRVQVHGDWFLAEELRSYCLQSVVIVFKVIVIDPEQGEIALGIDPKHVI